MKILSAHLDGLLLLAGSEPLGGFGDDEADGIDLSEAHLLTSTFVKNELSGLYFHEGPSYKGRLINVTEGEAFLVAVDIRNGSPTYGRWHSECLTSLTSGALWAPRGFAYGVLALTDHSTLSHRIVGDSDPEFGRCIRWNDPDLSIYWPLDLYQGLIFEPPKLGACELSGEAFASISSKL